MKTTEGDDALRYIRDVNMNKFVTKESVFQTLIYPASEKPERSEFNVERTYWE